MSILSSDSNLTSNSNKIYHDYEYNIIVEKYQTNKSRFVEQNIHYIHLKTHLNTLKVTKTPKHHHSFNRFEKTNQSNYKQKTYDNKSIKHGRQNSFRKNHNQNQHQNQHQHLKKSNQSSQSHYHSQNKYSTLRKTTQTLFHSKSLSKIDQYKKTLRSHLNKYTTMNKEKIIQKVKTEIEDVLSKDKREDVFAIFLDTYFEMIIKGKEYLQLYLELFEVIFIKDNKECDHHKDLFLKYIEPKNIEYISLIENIQPTDTSDYDSFCLYNKESEKRIQYFTLSLLIYSMYIWTPDIVFTNNHAFDSLYGIWKQNILYEKHTTCCTEIIKIIMNILNNKSLFKNEFLKSLKFSIIDIYRTVQQKELCHGLSNKSYFEVINLNIDNI